MSIPAIQQHWITKFQNNPNAMPHFRGMARPTPGIAPWQKAGGSPSADVLLFGAGKKAQPPSDEDLVDLLIQLPKGFARRLQAAADKLGMSVGEFIVHKNPVFTTPPPKRNIQTQNTDIITGAHNGTPVKTAVKSLIGPEQIFDEWIDALKSAEEYVQISMYTMENLLLGGQANGADVNPAWQKQQEILKLIEEKARAGVRFQIILDNSVVRKYDEFNNPILPRRLNNDVMIDYLTKLKTEQQLPVDVIAYPKKAARIYHVKLLVVDGKKAIVGGMNLSNHSAANWDACVSLEGAEVANIQASTFHPDWLFAQATQNPDTPLADIQAALPTITPVSDPAIQVLNTRPREYAIIGEEGKEEIGDYLKQKLDDPNLNSVYSEQFIVTHKELKEKLIQLHNRGKDVKFLHSESVVEEFPYCRNVVAQLAKANVPIRYYNEWEEIQEKLHAKWTVFNNEEILIGSANMSAAGLETNMATGLRDDYPNHPKQRYVRGNRDLALVIPSKKLANTFSTQFKQDWEHSPLVAPTGYGESEQAGDFNPFADAGTQLLAKLKRKGQ